MAASNVMRMGVLLMLTACASQPKRADLFIAELASMLPGSYDNLAQSRQGGGHVALKLVIAPVQVPLVGEHVYYVQEMAADDERRVLAQRLYVLRPIEGSERAVLSQADFAETARWRDGHRNRDLFKSMLPHDLRPRAGCDLIITRQKEKRGFAGIGGSGCRIAAAGSGETLRVEQRLELSADGLAVFEEQRDAAGAVVRGGGGSDPWYRYARRADTPW
jgi:hypothetical protein